MEQLNQIVSATAECELLAAGYYLVFIIFDWPVDGHLMADDVV